MAKGVLDIGHNGLDVKQVGKTVLGLGLLAGGIAVIGSAINNIRR